MRFILPFLFSLLCFTALAQTATPNQLTRQDSALFEKLMTGLNATDAGQLLHIYRTQAKVIQVRPNHHVASTKDSLLTVATPADQLKFLTNRYKTLLLAATITSDKVSFGGMRIGIDKADFCRRLHLKSAYTRYVFLDGEENFLQLTFTFAANKLARVDYKMLRSYEDID